MASMSSLLRRVAPLVIGMLAVLCIGAGAYVARTPAIADCTGARELDAPCYIERYTALTRSAGPKAALNDLERRKDNSQFVLAACHQLTHVIGRTAGERDGKAAFAQGSELCASGFYHGVTESVMAGIGRANILERAQSVCAEQREQHTNTYLHYNCVHGMGHGFMGLFDSDVFQALPGCDALTDPWERHHCYGGVFMENMTAMENPARPSRQVRPQEPLYPCTAIDDRYKNECYAEQTAYALHMRQGDFSAVFAMCRDQAGDFRSACYEGLGGDAAIKTSKLVIGAEPQARTLSALCMQAPDVEARAGCVSGAVKTIVDDTAGVDAQARALCAALPDQTLAALCETRRVEGLEAFKTTGGAHHH